MNQERLAELIGELIEMFRPSNPDAGLWGIVRHSVLEESTPSRILFRLESQIVARNLATDLNRMEAAFVKGSGLRFLYDVVDITEQEEELAPPKEAN